MLSSLYRLLTDLGAPAIDHYMRRRLAHGKEDPERFAERFGHPSRPRPAGRLVWCHAASVGEAVSLLLLIDRLHDTYPDITVLLTTGTVAAAKLMTARLPPYALHQYVPIDRAPCVERFLAHWDPALTILIESELWPNTLAALRRRLVPTVLLNGRLTDRSFRNWRRVKGWARELMAGLSLVLAQTEDDRGRFVALGASPVKCLGNLKFAAQPLPYDEAELAKLRELVGSRPCWLMASTHRGEEDAAIAAHKEAAKTIPGLLTIIAPRHPARGDEIAALLAAAGLRVARRSKNEPLTPETEVYFADTMGEMGLFYRLCTVAVVCGSFAPIGGHNPIEPAQLDAAIVFGPYMFKSQGIAQEFLRAEAAIQLQHANELGFTVARLLGDERERTKLAQSARILADQKRHVLDQIVAELRPWLSPHKN